jgi:flavin reductase (DIM6/NTAB) family NADH-FMN oxidoreductase RutF
MVEKIAIRNYPMLSPVPIVLIGSYVGGVANFATVGAFGVVCEGPLLYASLKATHFTTSGIRASGCFSVNVPSPSLVRETDYCGLVTGSRVDKSAVFETFDDPSCPAPMVRECHLNILCTVVDSKPVRGFEVFFGEIVSTFMDSDCFTDGEPDPAKTDPLIGIGGEYFALGAHVGGVFRAGGGLVATVGPGTAEGPAAKA